MPPKNLPPLAPSGTQKPTTSKGQKVSGQNFSSPIPNLHNIPPPQKIQKDSLPHCTLHFSTGRPLNPAGLLSETCTKKLKIGEEARDREKERGTKAGTMTVTSYARMPPSRLGSTVLGVGHAPYPQSLLHSPTSPLTKQYR